MHKIYITGIAGFIGFHMAERLAMAGYEVGGVDDFNDYYDPQLKRDRQQILKEKFNQVINDATLHNTYIENAFIQAQSIYRHKAAKERFLKII